MGTEGHPFPVNMVDAAPTTEEDKCRLRTMLLIVERAKRSGMVDPWAQVSAADLK